MQTETTAIVTFDPAAHKAGLAALEADLLALETVEITSNEMAQALGAVLIEQLKELDLAQEVRDKYTKPVYQSWKDLCALFKYDLDLRTALCDMLKAKVKAWELRQLKAREQATETVKTAMLSGAPLPVEALDQTNAHTQHAAGVSTRVVWVIKRFVDATPCKECGSCRGMVPREYWTEGPDTAKLKDLAARHKGAEPPIVPGVVFEQDVAVTGRRK